MRLWLRQHHGLRSQYPKAWVTAAAVSLGYNRESDMMLAYAVFAEDRPADSQDCTERPMRPADRGNVIGGVAADALMGSLFYPDGDG